MYRYTGLMLIHAYNNWHNVIFTSYFESTENCRKKEIFYWTMSTYSPIMNDVVSVYAYNFGALLYLILFNVFLYY